MHFRASLLAAVAALVVAAGCASAPAWMKNGMPAPELSGDTVDGQPVRLSAEKGKVVAVVFFADWCSICRGVYKTERELAKRMADKPFVLIGVDADDGASVLRDAIRRERLEFPIILDTDKANVAAWGVTGLPTTYVIDKLGVIRAFDLRGDSFVEEVDALIAEPAAAAQ
jgi:peroxiredoxin